jgi:hypothetical protein
MPSSSAPALPSPAYGGTVRIVNRFPILFSFLFAVSVFAYSRAAIAGEEITLFNGQGRASAYIALEDELTIYLWSGKPVAYLQSDSAGGFHLYGFNGKHLGWFVDGIVRDHDGNAACAVKERLQYTEYEPYKGYKAYKPYKGYKAYAPYRPIFSFNWGLSCGLLLC